MSSDGRHKTDGRRPTAPGTVAGLIGACAAELQAARVYFGHGTGNARDEAASLVFHVMGLDHADPVRAYGL
ncbi:MAG: hypothetical protein ABIX37_04745, partial [Gammaproteobacteria bacterium]